MDSDNIVIKHLTDDLLPQIINLNRDEYWHTKEEFQQVSFDEKFEKGRWWINKDTLIWHRKILHNCHGDILIAIKNEKIIGELDYLFSHDYINSSLSNRIHIIWLLIDKEYRRKGIAKLLLQYLKSLYPDTQIWVEAEDEKSSTLYSSFGKKLHLIQNWIYHVDLEKKAESNVLAKLDARSLSYTELLEFFHKHEFSLEFGNYYAPCFDLSQLTYSEPVHNLIWGELPKAPVYLIKYLKTEVCVVLTQYIRLFIKKGEFDFTNLKYIMNWIISKLTGIGFVEIYIQNYQQDQKEKILKKLGFKLISSEDYVFLI